MIISCSAWTTKVSCISLSSVALPKKPQAAFFHPTSRLCVLTVIDGMDVRLISLTSPSKPMIRRKVSFPVTQSLSVNALNKTCYAERVCEVWMLDAIFKGFARTHSWGYFPFLPWTQKTELGAGGSSLYSKPSEELLSDGEDCVTEQALEAGWTRNLSHDFLSAQAIRAL